MKLVVKIPPHKELLVTEAQEVDFGYPFFKMNIPQKTTIPVASTLSISPQKIFLNLKKFVGDSIKKGDVLAENKSFLSTKQYVSDVEGVITEIDHLTGNMVVEAVSDNADIVNCFFKGTVTAVTPEELELQVVHANEYPIFPVDNYLGGEVSYFVGRSTLSEEQIENKIIFAEEIIPYDQIKLETLGARGFITIKELKKPTELTVLKVKEHDHFAEIQKNALPYCILSADHTTMYFYH